VLVVVLSNGGSLLVSYPDGALAVLVTAEDSGLLRQRLDGAFGHPNGMVAPGNKVMCAKKVQP
jgi:hypothetical protein